MPGELGPLPGGELTVELVFKLGQFHPQLADFLLGAGFPVTGRRKFFDLLFDFAERLFKFQVVSHRPATIPRGWGGPPSKSRYDTRERVPLPSTSSTSATKCSLAHTVRFGSGAVSASRAPSVRNVSEIAVPPG